MGSGCVAEVLFHLLHEDSAQEDEGLRGVHLTPPARALGDEGEGQHAAVVGDQDGVHIVEGAGLGGEHLGLAVHQGGHTARPGPHVPQVGVAQVRVVDGGRLGLLHHGEREEMLPGGDVQPGVQHEGHLLELDHVAWLVGIVRQRVESHVSVIYFLQIPQLRQFQFCNFFTFLPSSFKVKLCLFYFILYSM